MVWLVLVKWEQVGPARPPPPGGIGAEARPRQISRRLDPSASKGTIAEVEGHQSLWKRIHQLTS